MRRRLCTILDLSIVASSLFLLPGCFYWPTGDRPNGGVAPMDRVGPGKELTLGTSTPGDVDRAFPTQTRWNPDLTWAVVTYNARAGYWVWPLALSAWPHYEQRALRLHFSPEQRLDLAHQVPDYARAFRGTGINPAAAPTRHDHPTATRPPKAAR